MSSAPKMLPNMRRSKLKSTEAALLAGELKKPSWESRNEGIHERVSFEDSIWGFDLAGGVYYNTPLRVTAVKNDSRAQKAGIRPGDKLLRINDIDTATLTIQEAHEIIIESGIHIRLAVSAPDDTEDSYGCWQDQVDQGYDSEEERRLEAEKAKKRIIHCRTNANWSLQWPWVSKRRIIYKESNCFMVPSKYEGKHREKFPLQIVGLKAPEDIVLHSKTSDTPTTEPTELKFPEKSPTNNTNNIKENGTQENKIAEPENVLSNGDGNKAGDEDVHTKTNASKMEMGDNDEKDTNEKDIEVLEHNDDTKTQTFQKDLQNSVLNLDELQDLVKNGLDENAQDQILDEVLEDTDDTSTTTSQPDEYHGTQKNMQPEDIAENGMDENEQDQLLDEVLNGEHNGVEENDQDITLDDVLNGNDQNAAEVDER